MSSVPKLIYSLNIIAFKTCIDKSSFAENICKADYRICFGIW